MILLSGPAGTGKTLTCESSQSAKQFLKSEAHNGFSCRSSPTADLSTTGRESWLAAKAGWLSSFTGLRDSSVLECDNALGRYVIAPGDEKNPPI